MARPLRADFGLELFGLSNVNDGVDTERTMHSAGKDIDDVNVDVLTIEGVRQY